MSDSLSLLYEGLRSNLTTKRKATLKSLVTFLEQEQQADEEASGNVSAANTSWLRRLDAATAAVPPGTPLPQGTWPALLHETIRCVSSELGLGNGRNLRDPPRPADVTAARALRAVVAAADSASRRPRGVSGLSAATTASGASALTTSPAAALPPLYRRARQLLRHVRDVLLASPVHGNALTTEYLLLLRTQLLPPRADAGAYLGRAAASVVRDLIAWAAGAAEAAVSGGQRTAAEQEEEAALGASASASSSSASAALSASSASAAEAEQALVLLSLLLRCAFCDVGAEARDASYRAVCRVASALNAAASAAAEEGLADLTAGGVGGGEGGGVNANDTATNDAAAAGLPAAATALSRLEPSPLAVPVYARVHGALLQAAAALLEREGTEMEMVEGSSKVRQLSLLCRPSAAAAWRVLGPGGRSSRDKRIRAAAVAYVSALEATGQLHDDAEFVAASANANANAGANASTSSSSSSPLSPAVAQSASSILELLAWVRGAIANESFPGWKKAGPESSSSSGGIVGGGGGGGGGGGPTTPGGRRALLQLAAAVEAAAGLSRPAPSLRAVLAAHSSSSSSLSAAANAAAAAVAAEPGDDDDEEEEREGAEEDEARRKRARGRGRGVLRPHNDDQAQPLAPPAAAAPKRRKTTAANGAITTTAVAAAPPPLPLPLPPPLVRVVASRAGSAARWAPVAAAALLSMAPGPSARDVASMLAGAAEGARRLRAPGTAPSAGAAAAAASAAVAASAAGVAASVTPATAEAAVSLLRLLEAAVVSCPRSLLRALRAGGAGALRGDDDDDDDEEGNAASADDETSDEEDEEDGNVRRRRRRRRRALSASASAALASLTSWAAAWLGCPAAPHAVADAAAAALAAVARRGLLVGSSAAASAARRSSGGGGGNAPSSSSLSSPIPVSVAAASAFASSPGLLLSRDPLPRHLLALLAAAPPANLPSLLTTAAATTSASAPPPPPSSSSPSPHATGARGALLERVLSPRTLAASPALAAAAAAALLGRGDNSGGGRSYSSSSSPLDDFEAESLADLCFDPSSAALPRLSFGDLATPPPHAPPPVAGDAGLLLDAPPLAGLHAAFSSSSSWSSSISSTSSTSSPVEAAAALDRATRAHRAARARAELARLPSPAVPLTKAAAAAAADAVATALASALEAARRDSQAAASLAQEAAQQDALAAAQLAAACAAAAAGNDGGRLDPSVAEGRRAALERLRFASAASQERDLALVGAWHAASVVIGGGGAGGGREGGEGESDDDESDDDDDDSGLAASTHHHHRRLPCPALALPSGRVPVLLFEAAPFVASAAVRLAERAGNLGPRRGDPARDELLLRSLASLSAAVAASSSSCSSPPSAAAEATAEDASASSPPPHPSVALARALEAASSDLARLCADADASADRAVQAAATAAAGTLSDDELDDNDGGGGGGGGGGGPGFGGGASEAAPMQLTAPFGKNQHDDFDLTAAVAFPSTLTMVFGGSGGGGASNSGGRGGSALAAALATARRDAAVRVLAALARAAPSVSARALAGIAERWTLRSSGTGNQKEAMLMTQDGGGGSEYETPPPPAALERLLAALVGVARVGAVSALDCSVSPAASAAMALVMRGGLVGKRKESAFVPSRALLVGAWAVAGIARATLDRCAALSASSSASASRSSSSSSYSSSSSSSRRLLIDATRSDAADLLWDPLAALIDFAGKEFKNPGDETDAAAALSGPGSFARAALATAASACLAAGGAKHWTEANAELVVEVVVEGGVKVPRERQVEQQQQGGGGGGGGGGGRGRQAATAAAATEQQQPTADAKPAFALRLAAATPAATLTRPYLRPSIILLHLERAARLGDPATGEVTRDGAGLALLGASLAAAEGGWVSLCPALDAAPASSSSPTSSSSTSSHSPYLLMQEAKASEDGDAQERAAVRALLTAAGMAAAPLPSSGGRGRSNNSDNANAAAAAAASAAIANVRLQRTARAALRAGSVALGYGSRAQYVRARALWIASDWTGVGYDDAAAQARAAGSGLTPQQTTTGTPKRPPPPPGELAVLPRPMLPIPILAAAAPCVGGRLRTGRALLRELSPHLVPALAVNQDGLGLRALAAFVSAPDDNAAAASADAAAAALVREHYASIMAAVLPGSRHYGLANGGGSGSGGGRVEGRKSVSPTGGGGENANAENSNNNGDKSYVIGQGLLHELLPSVEESDELFERSTPQAVADILLLAASGEGWGVDLRGRRQQLENDNADAIEEEEDEKATPFPALDPNYASDAAHALLRALNRGSEARGPAPLRALVRARAAAASARGRRHRAAAMGPLRAVISFLTPPGAASAGATFAVACSLVEAALNDGGSLARACCGELRWLLGLEEEGDEDKDGDGDENVNDDDFGELEGSAPRLLSLLCRAVSVSAAAAAADADAGHAALRPLASLAAAFASRMPRGVACDVPPTPRRALAPVRAALELRCRRNASALASSSPSPVEDSAASFVEDLVRFSLRAPSLALASREAAAKKLRRRLRASLSSSSSSSSSSGKSTTTLLLPSLEQQEGLEEAGGESAERAAAEASAAARRAAWRLVRAGVAAAEWGHFESSNSCTLSLSSLSATAATATATSSNNNSQQQQLGSASPYSSSATLRLAADVLATLGPPKVGASLPPINGVSTSGEGPSSSSSSSSSTMTTTTTTTAAAPSSSSSSRGCTPDLKSALASLFPFLVDAVEAAPSQGLAAVAQDCLEALVALPVASEALKEIRSAADDARDLRRRRQRRSSATDGGGNTDDGNNKPVSSPESEAAASALRAAEDAAHRALPYGVPVTLEAGGPGEPASTTLPRRSPPPQLKEQQGGAREGGVAAAAAEATLDDPWPLLLEPGRLPASQWARRLAFAVLRRAGAPELRACAAFALADRAAAELLLPHALADLALNNSEEDKAPAAAAAAAAATAAATAAAVAAAAAAASSPPSGITGVLASVFESALAGACSSSSASSSAALSTSSAPLSPSTCRTRHSDSDDLARLLLRCLDHLRSLREDVFAQAPTLAERPSSPASKRFPAYMASELAELRGPMCWPSCCWLRVRYETVARAALQCCGDPHAAQLWGELAVEESVASPEGRRAADEMADAAVRSPRRVAGGVQRGTAVPASSSAAVAAYRARGSTGDAVAASVPRSLGAVLLGASRATAEPDGIYWAAALAGGLEGSSGAQLALLQHEGDWAGAAALCDATAAGGGFFGGSGSGGSGCVGASMMSFCGFGSGRLFASSSAVASASAPSPALPAALLQLGCSSSAASVAKALLLSGWSNDDSSSSSGFDSSELRDAAAEAAWRMGQWRSAVGSSSSSSADEGLPSPSAAAAAASSSSPSSSSFNVSVCAALAAIQERAPEAAASALAAARSSVIFDELATAWGSGSSGSGGDTYDELGALAAPSAAATAAISRLQMLATLEEALSSTSTASATSNADAANAPSSPSSSPSLSFASARARSREAATARALGAGSGLGFAALEPLIAVRRAASAALGDAAAERAALVDAARAARVAGRVPAARAALAALRAPIDALSSSSSSLLFGSPSERERRRRTGAKGSGELPVWVRSEVSPAAPWRREELELLWEGGQHASALRVARGLLADAAAAERGASSSGGKKNEGDEPSRRSLFAPPASSSPISPVWRAGLMSLVGKWLAESGLEGPAAALDTLRAATAEADAAAREIVQSDDGDPSSSRHDADRTACTASFRLASYADKLHAGAVARRSSPEAAKAAALVAARRASKLKPLEVERAANAAKLREAEASLARNPSSASARDAKARAEQQERYLAWHIANEKKQLDADLVFPRELARNERAYLSTAISAYGRALEAADAHDLHAVHRFLALFLAHGRRKGGGGGSGGSGGGNGDGNGSGNGSGSSSSSVCELARSALRNVSSHKFVPLVPQIASRLSTVSDAAAAKPAGGGGGKKRGGGGSGSSRRRPRGRRFPRGRGESIEDEPESNPEYSDSDSDDDSEFDEDSGDYSVSVPDYDSEEETDDDDDYGASGSARRDDEGTVDFQREIGDLLVRIGKDHPFHALWTLLSLKNGDRDREGEQVREKPWKWKHNDDSSAEESAKKAEASRAKRAKEINFSKCHAAAAVLARVAASSAESATFVREATALADVYIRLAAVPAPTAESSTRPAPTRSTFPAQLRQRAATIKSLPLASLPLPVRRDGDYSSAPRFAGFETEINYVGGINKPKVVKALAAGGVIPPRRELVKSGSDDLRQDAAIQQFFALVNSLLAADGAAAARALRLRTYRAVPFSPSSGLLQWVDDCIPLSEYLLGPDRNSGAHGRRGMRANQMALAGTTGLSTAPTGGGGANAASASSSSSSAQPPPPILHGTAASAMHRSKPENLRLTYDWVCDRFPPVLRHFFTENFRSPRAWAAARLSYARSTAAASMAGYVIGLGDRHSHNILLDLRSAEAVHIDLGIAFEQGSFLATPELVPFRLTRDIVDGLGPAGVDGVLRGACEAAMSAMRAPDARAALASVVEVLVHDPLYKWGISEEKKNKTKGAQEKEKKTDDEDDDDDELGNGNDPIAISITNADAERALLRVRNKLAGLDAGDGEARGIRAQVRQLLADAADPALLCRMYVGWAAWV